VQMGEDLALCVEKVVTWVIDLVLKLLFAL
jgi:hypothetical protein